MIKLHVFPVIFLTNQIESTGRPVNTAASVSLTQNIVGEVNKRGSQFAMAGAPFKIDV